MIIKCPECELQVSDKALNCPHCGFPVSPTAKPRKKHSNRRMKLPNGFGQITEIKGRNLRCPFRVMIPVGKTDEGKPISKLLKPKAYYETYNDAYAALIDFNKNPYDLDDDITVQELYNRWSEAYFAQLDSDSSQRTITSAWAYCSSLVRMRAKDVRPRHIKGCMEDGYRVEYRGKNKGNKVFATASTKSRIKSLFNLMYDYALEYELVDVNYARVFDISDDVTKEIEINKVDHIIFTEDELNVLWDGVNQFPFVDWVLIQCYMGWRPQELATLRLTEVNMKEWYMQAGMKTPAGKQRIVPIHSRIRDLVVKNYEYAVSIGSAFLFNDKGYTHSSSWAITYDKYRDRFNKVMDRLNLAPEHRPHDPRKTFVTRAKKAGMDKYAIKAMVGHKIQDITESTYTERDIEWLRTDMEKIT